MSYLQDYLDNLNGGLPGGSLSKIKSQYELGSATVPGMFQPTPYPYGNEIQAPMNPGPVPGGYVQEPPPSGFPAWGATTEPAFTGFADGGGAKPLLSNGQPMPKVGQASTEQAAYLGANPADAWKFFYQGW